MNNEILNIIKTVLESSSGKGISPEMLDMIMMVINVYVQSQTKEASNYITNERLEELMNKHHKFMMDTFPERIKDLKIIE